MTTYLSMGRRVVQWDSEWAQNEGHHSITNRLMLLRSFKLKQRGPPLHSVHALIIQK